MLEFTPLQLEDLPKLRDYFGYSGSRLCDTTPGAVFIWRDMYRSEWAYVPKRVGRVRRLPVF